MADYIPIKLSQLPEIDSPLDYWIFGSKDNLDGSLTSGKYSLSRLEDSVLDIVSNIQLERRFSYTIESGKTMFVAIGEDTTIYRIKAWNATGVKITVNGTQYNVSIDAPIDIEIPSDTIIEIDTTPEYTDTRNIFIYIFAKAKIV